MRALLLAALLLLPASLSLAAPTASACTQTMLLTVGSASNPTLGVYAESNCYPFAAPAPRTLTVSFAPLGGGPVAVVPIPAIPDEGLLVCAGTACVWLTPEYVAYRCDLVGTWVQPTPAGDLTITCG